MRQYLQNAQDRGKVTMDGQGPRGTQQLLASLITFFLKNLKIIMNKELKALKECISAK